MAKKHTPDQHVEPAADSGELPEDFRDGVEDTDIAMSQEEITNQQQPGADVIPATDEPAPAQAAPPARDEVPAQGQESEPVFPADLLEEAGMTEEEAIEQFGTPDALQRTLEWQVRQIMQHQGRVDPRQRQTQQQLPPPAFQPPPPPQQRSDQTRLPAGMQVDPQQQPQETYKPFADIAAAMKDDDGEPLFAESTIKLLKEMDRHNAAQFQALEQRWRPVQEGWTSFEQQQRAARERAEYESYEQFFSELGPEWHDVFGEGDAIERLQRNPNDPQVNARKAFVATKLALEEKRQVLGLPPLSESGLRKQALRAAFLEKSQTVSLRPPDSAGTRRTGLMRPTQRRTPGGTPEERAIANVEALLAKRGRKSSTASASDIGLAPGEF